MGKYVLIALGTMCFVGKGALIQGLWCGQVCVDKSIVCSVDKYVLIE